MKIPCKKVFTSLRGYGDTEESRSAKDYKIDHQLEIIRAISKKLNSNFHIVGHSMGGLVGFAAVFSGEFPIKSIITFEGNPPWILDNFKYNGTLNKTLKSYVFAIIGAEYIMRWLPIGTHEWEKFVIPEDLIKILKKYNLSIDKLDGMKFNLIKDQWSISSDKSVNYIGKFIKD